MTHNCRDCAKDLRRRCIQACSTSPSVKKMMHRAFAAGTDTQDMWGLLQMRCLQEWGEQKQQPTLLGRRLKGEEEPTEALEEAAPSHPPEPEASPRPAQRVETVGRGERQVALSRYCLALQDSRHRIALPKDGQVVLGRFDPLTGVLPDVDLSYDDRDDRVVSRRHAQIIARGNWHEIEDLGSTNGTLVNGRQLQIGQQERLHTGDRVTLGDHEFVYQPLSGPPTSSHTPPTACLWAMFTGRRFSLPASGEVIVGRSDPVVGVFPEIDLGEEGDAARVVARRHVKIVVRDGRHYVEDLGSAGGTKISGVSVKMGKQSPLEPGDHLWLGGCVLAYDVES